MKIGLKIFLIILVQILIGTLFYFPLTFILSPLNLSPIVFAFIETILFGISLYFSLVILAKNFIAEDVNALPKWIAIIGAGLGIAGLILLGSSGSISDVIQVVTSPVLGYFITKLFLQNKFSIKS